MIKNPILILALVGSSFFAHGQIINQTSFESWPDEQNFTINNLRTDGFTVPWVNGFNQSRCFVDDAYSASGTKSLRVKYPANQYGTSATGAQAPLKFTGRDEVYAAYSLRFSDDFDWGGKSEGGKLPGLGSGDNCSGGSSCDGTNGFSARLMWRTGGHAVLYLYHMDKPNTYGEDIDLIYPNNNKVVFQKGQWYQVAERVKINTGNNSDGEIDLWINGEPVLSLTGLRFVNNGDKIDNLYFSTFHGGSGIDWAPGNDSYIWFDDIIIAESKSDIFTITSTNSVADHATFSASPNPTEGIIHLKESLSYTLTSPDGILILEGKSDKINLSNLSKGVYTLKTEKGIQKIVKY